MSVFVRLVRDPASYLVLMAGLIVTVLVMQHGFGYLPCALCYWQRYPYYALLAVGLPYLALRLAGRAGARWDRPMLLLVGLAFLASGMIGFYHAGVERHWWAGPGQCSGTGDLPMDPDAMMAMLGRAKIVPCDEPALVILGLSLAGWNAVIGITAGLLALIGSLGCRKTEEEAHG